MIILLTQSLYRSSMVDLGTLSLVSYAFPELGVNHFLFPVPRKKTQNQPPYHRQIGNHLLQLNLDSYLLFSLILDKLNTMIKNYDLFHITWIIYIYNIKLSTFDINLQSIAEFAKSWKEFQLDWKWNGIKPQIQAFHFSF